MSGYLSITVAQAKLTKNYGMTRMDPYCRIRAGHVVYDTPTDSSSGKNPQWNTVIYCLLRINTITIEIYDKRFFTADELIAWAQIVIPQQVFTGETHEDRYPLDGKQGKGVEGMIKLAIRYTVYAPCVYVPRIGPSCSVQPFTVEAVPNARSTVSSVPVLSESELKQIKEMFPNIEKEVIKTVFEANKGNKGSTINTLLQIAE